MRFSFLTVLFWLLSALGIFSFGCQATGHAIDSTKLAQAVTEAEKHPGVIQFPASWIDESSGGVIQMTTHAGKDYDVTVNFADGTPKVRLTAKRSAVLDSLLAGIDTLDLHKQAYEGAQTDKIIDLTKWGISQGIALATARGVGPLPALPGADGLASNPQLTLKQQIAEAVKSEVPGIIEALKSSLAK